MNKFLKDMLSDVHGTISHKRVITTAAFILFSVMFIADGFFDITIDINAYYVLFGIISGGMGFSASEYLFKGKPPKSTNI